MPKGLSASDKREWKLARQRAQHAWKKMHDPTYLTKKREQRANFEEKRSKRKKEDPAYKAAFNERRRKRYENDNDRKNDNTVNNNNNKQKESASAESAENTMITKASSVSLPHDHFHDDRDNMEDNDNI